MPARRRSRASGAWPRVLGSLRATSASALARSSSSLTASRASAATSSATPLVRSSCANARRARPRPDCRDSTQPAANAASSMRPISVNRSSTAVAESSGTLRLAAPGQLGPGARPHGELPQADGPSYRLGVGVDAGLWVDGHAVTDQVGDRCHVVAHRAEAARMVRCSAGQKSAGAGSGLPSASALPLAAPCRWTGPRPGARSPGRRGAARSRASP